MEFQVLGPISASHEGVALKLGGPKQRLVLALMLAAHGNRVSTDTLMDNVWPEGPPASARKTLQVYVHHLRCEIGSAVETIGNGYRLDVDSNKVDERAFSVQVAEARSQIQFNPALASGKLRSALARWRGSPYADCDGSLSLLPEITRLSEARLAALGDRIDCDLTLGRHKRLVGELASLTVQYPLHERFRAQEMVALFRSGRTPDALRSYRQIRERYIDELGIEPSDSLAELEMQMLTNDQSLLHLSGSPAGAKHSLKGYELQKSMRKSDRDQVFLAYQPSVGRQVAIRVIGPRMRNDPAFMERYWSDAAALGMANHPNILYVQDTWLDEGNVYEVMEWIEGQRLDQYLAETTIAPTTAHRIYEQISGAVRAAHAVGVVHGAVGCASVMITRRQDAYLKDFIGWERGTTEEDLAGLKEFGRDLGVLE